MLSVTVGVSENVSLAETDPSDAERSLEADSEDVLDAVNEDDAMSPDSDGVVLDDRLRVKLIDGS